MTETTKRKVLKRLNRTVYTITMAGERNVNTFTSDRTIIDVIGNLWRNYFTMGDLTKVIKTDITVNQYEDGYEKFEEVTDITDKVISDTIPKVLGKYAELINFDKIEG